jgi:uncharacterized alkaline shock family protein YloU
VIEAVQQWLWNLDANLALVSPPILLVMGVALALLVDVVCVVLIWLEFRRPRPKAIRVQSVTGGQAELAVDSVARRLERSISGLEGVISVKPNVWGRRGGVEVELDLETGPEIDVPTKTEEVCQVTKEAVEDKMGLKLRKVRVHVKHTPYPTEPPMASEDASFPIESPVTSDTSPSSPLPSEGREGGAEPPMA